MPAIPQALAELPQALLPDILDDGRDRSSEYDLEVITAHQIAAIGAITYLSPCVHLWDYDSLFVRSVS